MRIVAIVFAGAIVAGSMGFAQEKPQTSRPAEEKPAASARPEPRRLVPLTVRIVLTRLKGDKKIGSLPYQLGLAANDGMFANLRMGIDVPVATSGGIKTAPSSYNYRSVGTNIDCMAESLPGDMYRLQLRVEDSSVVAEPTGTASTAEAGIAANLPAFRTFKSSFTLFLRDGQTAQHTSAVDPISGEVMRIDVTLDVMK